MTAANNDSVAGCLPALVAAYTALQRAASPLGITFTVADYGGLRDQATTQQLQQWEAQAVAAGQKPYPVAPWGESKHDVGAAFDARIVDAGGWTDALLQLGSLAQQCGLLWGGTWPGTKEDRPHFELPASLAELRTDWSAFTTATEGEN